MLLLWFYCDCRWIHDYQDACVDKLEQFLHGEMNSRCSSGSRPPLTKANSLGTTTELHGMHSLRPANPVSSAAKTPDTAWAELSGGGGYCFLFIQQETISMICFCINIQIFLIDIISYFDQL